MFEQDNVFIAGVFWTECGMIDNVVRGKLPLACLSGDPRNIAFNIDLIEHEGKDAYIAAVMFSDQSVINGLLPFFEKVERAAEVTINRFGRPAMKPVRIFKASKLQPNHELEGINAKSVDLKMLPRTQISRLEGTLSAASEINETAQLILGEQLVGEVEMNGSTQSFDIQPPRNWGVGIRVQTLR